MRLLGVSGGVLGPGVDGCVVKLKGPSAGQSAMFFLYDALLGVDHAGPMAAFAEEMLDSYTPLAHRMLVRNFQAGVGVFGGAARRAVLGGRCSAATVVAFDDCVRGLAAFRKLHGGVVGRYLAARGARTGTGASSFGPMLAAAVAATAAQGVPAAARAAAEKAAAGKAAGGTGPAPPAWLAAATVGVAVAVAAEAALRWRRAGR